MYQIATWNVNSIRVRAEHVATWLEKNPVDVLALQEIKVLSEKFPTQLFEDLGYHVAVSGQPTYNGVAVLSKQAQDVDSIITDFPGFDDVQRRVLGVKVDDIFILDLYVPNGSEVGSEKYAYKLEWLKHLYSYLQALIKQESKVVVLGDFNIAPRDQDVHDPAAWEGKILVSPEERVALQAIIDLGFVDSYELKPAGATVFSWWDYRMAGFRRDLGMRIDHVLVSTALESRIDNCFIDREPRGWERPSDHAPVVLTL